MGTTTIFTRRNDFGQKLSKSSNKDIKKIDIASPYDENKSLPHGWDVPLELHNGNCHILVWWYGRLIRLEDAPKQLTKKYYSRWQGRTCKEYEWTLLKKYIQSNLESLDKEFKKIIRKKRNKKGNNNK